MNKVIDHFDGYFRFLSNFWPDRGITNEHLYQAAKTDDEIWKERILKAPTPNLAKKIGRQCPIRESWEDEKDEVMLKLLRLKFTKGTSLALMLLETNDSELIEGNWWGDTYWGVCNGEGQNKLGQLLMQVRKELSE